jgi:hypothetical protein
MLFCLCAGRERHLDCHVRSISLNSTFTYLITAKKSNSQAGEVIKTTPQRCLENERWCSEAFPQLPIHSPGARRNQKSSIIDSATLGWQSTTCIKREDPRKFGCEVCGKKSTPSNSGFAWRWVHTYWYVHWDLTCHLISDLNTVTHTYAHRH